jgi:hypothetical protein
MNPDEIRVWIHPKRGGDDFYYQFRGMGAYDRALQFSKSRPHEAENPLFVYGGREYNKPKQQKNNLTRLMKFF